MLYGSLVGIYSAVHPRVFPLLSLLPSRGVGYIGQFAEQAIEETKKEVFNSDDEESKVHQGNRPSTFLEKALLTQSNDPKRMRPYDVLHLCRGNVAAGSDATGITLAAAFYYLQKTPGALQK